MADKYRATLHGDRLEWENGSPPVSDEPNGVAVEAVVKALKKPNGEKMAAALEALAKLADRGGIKSIKILLNGSELRKDRPLPGR